MTPGIRAIRQQITIAESNLVASVEPYPGYKASLPSHIKSLKADLAVLETVNSRTEPVDAATALAGIPAAYGLRDITEDDALGMLDDVANIKACGELAKNSVAILNERQS